MGPALAKPADVRVFVAEMSIKVALYTHFFATCNLSRQLAGKIIKAELTRLQPLTSTWKQTLTTRVQRQDLISLKDLCSEGWCSFHSKPTATYCEELEKLRQEILPLAPMMDSPLLRHDGDGVWDFQDISFEFNPCSDRPADTLLSIGYHGDELAIAGFP